MLTGWTILEEMVGFGLLVGYVDNMSKYLNKATVALFFKNLGVDDIHVLLLNTDESGRRGGEERRAGEEEVRMEADMNVLTLCMTIDDFGDSCFCL